MIEERLEDFMNRVEILNDKISEYVNQDKGLRYHLNTPQLLCRVDRLELDKKELDVAKFKNQIENKDYPTTTVIKQVPKSDITKKDKDKFTIVDKEEEGSIIYNVSNQIGIHNSCTTQEEAFKLCEGINKKVYEVLCK